MQNPVKILRINGMEYNANRDPQIYRRMPKQAFQIQATLSGKGAVNIKFEAEGKVVAEKSVGLPGKFECAARLLVAPEFDPATALRPDQGHGRQTQKRPRQRTGCAWWR